MSNKVILDANFLVGYFDEDDIWHSKAVKLIDKKDLESVFLDCILNEVFSVLGRRANERGKADKFNEIVININKNISTDIIIWTYLDIRHYYQPIISLMKEHHGRLNFHDCLIALIAKEKNIKKIISFDQDFDKITWLERIG